MEQIKIMISEEYEDLRIDKCLSLILEDKSRSYIQKLLKSGNIILNGKNDVNASVKVKLDDEIQLNIPDAIELNVQPENIPLDILYEDNDIIIINKQKGMVVHPAPGHYTNTLVNALMYHCKDKLSGINGVLRPGIIHRIDKDTTGSLIVCKTNQAHTIMADMLKAHTIDRRYRAIVYGHFNSNEGIITGSIGRSMNDRKKMMVNAPNGKEAVTHYRVIKEYSDYSYIECKLETGRTHQIRVHMSYVNHPVLGDEVYSNRKCPFHLQGQTLHAYFLGFTHPITGEYLEVTAPLPEYFNHLLEILE